MILLEIKIGHLVSHEIRPEKSAAVFPCLAVLGEDTTSESRDHIIASCDAKLVVIELFGEHGLDVARIRCEVDVLECDVALECSDFAAMELAHHSLTPDHQVWEKLCLVCFHEFAEMLKSAEAAHGI
jgi:hypothetical protein